MPTVCAWLIVLLASAGSSDGAMAASRAEQDNLFMTRFMFACETGKLVKPDIGKLKLLMGSKDMKTSARATGLFAQYLDEVEDKPLDALLLLAPHVLKTDELNAWRNELIANRGKTRDEPGSKIRTLPAEFPQFSTWKQDQLELCVQVCRILTAFGKYEAALRGFDSIGRTLQGLPQILAAEAGGDVHSGLSRYSQALDFYNFALKASAYVKGHETYYKEIATELDFVVGRIKRKIEHINKIIEEEKYGAGFVA